MPPEGSGIAPVALHRVWARIPLFCAILGFRSRCQAARDGRFEQDRSTSAPSTSGPILQFLGERFMVLYDTSRVNPQDTFFREEGEWTVLVHCSDDGVLREYDLMTQTTSRNTGRCF